MPTPEILPNCLTRSKKIDFNLTRNGATWFYLYCANCGADGGRVMEADIPNASEFAFYLCNSCAEKHGGITATAMIPDEIFWRKVAEAQIEKYGRILTVEETALQLQDETSLMTTLKKEIR